MCRLTLRMVRSTFVTAWFLADWPTRTSPFLAKATTEGVVREPSALAMTVGSPPSRTLTTELVVPRSIPTARAMGLASLFVCACGACSVRRALDLASGALNFPAHPNGSPAPGVPQRAGNFLRAGFRRLLPTAHRRRNNPTAAAGRGGEVIKAGIHIAGG